MGRSRASANRKFVSSAPPVAALPQRSATLANRRGLRALVADAPEAGRDWLAYRHGVITLSCTVSLVTTTLTTSSRRKI